MDLALTFIEQDSPPCGTNWDGVCFMLSWGDGWMEPIPQQPEALEHTVTVLLAEDEVLIRLDVAEELRRAGWKVIEVASADDAIDILNSPVIVDLVVTDVNMPGEANGLDLARLVRRERRNVKVV